MTGALRNEMKKLVKENSVEPLREFMVEHSAIIFGWKPKYIADVMYLAVKGNKTDSLRVLIENGFDPNMRYYDTPVLHKAFDENSRESGFLLLELGADVNLLNFLGNSPIHHILMRGGVQSITVEELQTLKSHGYNPKNKYNMYLSDWEVAMRSHPAILVNMIEVFGEDFEADIDIPAARAAGEQVALFQQLSLYIMRIDFSDSGHKNSKLEGDILLLLKLGIQLGQIDYVKTLIEGFKGKNIGYGFREELESILGLIEWSEGASPEVFTPKISGIIKKHYSQSNMWVCVFGINMLLQKDVNHKKYLAYRQEFMLNVSHLARSGSSVKDFYSLLMRLFKNVEVEEDILEAIIKGDESISLMQVRKEFLTGVMYMAKGDYFKAEYFLTRASLKNKFNTSDTNIDFDDFFLVLFKPEMLDAIKKGTAL